MNSVMCFALEDRGDREYREFRVLLPTGGMLTFFRDQWSFIVLAPEQMASHLSAHRSSPIWRQVYP